VTVGGHNYTIYPNGTIVRHTPQGDVAFTRNSDGGWDSSFSIAVADGDSNYMAGTAGAETSEVVGTDAAKDAALAYYKRLPADIRKLIRDSFLNPATTMYAVSKKTGPDGKSDEVASEYQLSIGRFQKKSGEVTYDTTTLGGTEHSTTDEAALLSPEYPDGTHSLREVIHFHSHSDDRDPGLTRYDISAYNKGAVYYRGTLTVPLNYSGVFYGKNQVFYGWSDAGAFRLTFQEMRDALR
jgi:hypothetical protein